MTVLIVIGIVALVILVAGVAMYNGLVRLNVRVEEAWSDITVQLKRRLDLIPNLVNTVKGYAKHEAETLEKVAAERASVVKGGGSVKEAAQAENMISGALKSVLQLPKATRT